MAEFQFRVQIDHSQFYVDDWDLADCPDRPGTDAHYDAVFTLRCKHVAPSPGGIVVGTVTFAGTVEVTVEVRDDRPTVDLDTWDHGVETSLTSASGLLDIYAAEQAGDPDRARVPVAPGAYRVLVLAGNLESVTDELDPDDGDERYRIILWPGVDDTAAEPTVLKAGYWCCTTGKHPTPEDHQAWRERLRRNRELFDRA